MTGVTGRSGQSSSRSSRAASAESGSAVSGAVRTRTADRQKHADAKPRSQKSASGRDPPQKPAQKTAQKLAAPAKGELQRELSAIRERPDTAATEADLDGDRIIKTQGDEDRIVTTQGDGDGDGAESSPRDSGNHSLAGEEPVDLRESDNREADFGHADYKGTDHSEPEHREPENRELNHKESNYRYEEQHQEPEHSELEHRDPEHGEFKHRDPEHGELKHREPEHGESEYSEPGHEKPEHKESEPVESERKELKQEPDHKEQQPAHKTSKPGSRVSSKQGHRSPSKPASRASSKQSQRSLSKEDHRTSSKQSRRTPSKEDNKTSSRKELRTSSKQEVTSLKEEQIAPENSTLQSKPGQDASTVQEHEVHQRSEDWASHLEPVADPASSGLAEDPGTQDVPHTVLEPMSGDMEVLRAAEKISLAGGPDTEVPRSMSLEHVIIEKYHEEPQLEDDAEAYQGPVEIPPLLTDFEEESNEPGHTIDKHMTKTGSERGHESVREQRPDENHSKEHTARKAERAHPKPKENGPGKDSRASSKAAQHGTARTESRKQTANTKQNRKPTKIPRSKPVARSHEDLRADLHEGGNGKVATLRLPEDTAALQKSTSLVNIPRNPSALVSPTSGL